MSGYDMSDYQDAYDGMESKLSCGKKKLSDLQNAIRQALEDHSNLCPMRSLDCGYVYREDAVDDIFFELHKALTESA